MWNQSFGSHGIGQGFISFEGFTQPLSRHTGFSTTPMWGGRFWGNANFSGNGANLGATLTNLFSSLSQSIAGWQPRGTKPKHDAHEHKTASPKTANNQRDDADTSVKPEPTSHLSSQLRFPPPTLNPYLNVLNDPELLKRPMMHMRGKAAIDAHDLKNWVRMGHAWGAELREDEQGPYIHIGRSAEGLFPNWIHPGKSADNPDGLRVRISPIGVDLNDDGKVGVTSASSAKDAPPSALGATVQFDIDGDGTDDTTEWFAGDGDGILVDNRDGNAATDMSGKRLFGDQSGKFDSGYAQLAQLDANNDSTLTDDELNGLTMWVDNGDAKVQTGEFKNLEDLGITELSTQRHDVTTEKGETLMQSTATRHGQAVLTEDVWFQQA